MNLTLIYFVYGLAFFSLGLAVLVRVRPILHREVAGRLRWLGLFGLLHGVGEWTAMARMSGYTQAWLGSLEAVLFATSFAALMYFGLGWALRRENLARLTTFGCLALWVGVWLALPDAAVADVVGRYLLGVPAGLAVLVGFYRRRELFGGDRPGRLLFRTAMTGVAAYASMTAIAAPQDFFPASVLNHAAFEALVGTPVQLWRMLSAGLIATAIILALDRFDRHEKRQLAKSSEAAAIELRESLDLLQGIADNIPGGVYRRVRHADGSIEYPFFSPGFRRIFDRDPDRMMADAKHVLDGFHPDDRDGVLVAIETSAKNLDHYDREFRFVGEDGRVLWCRSIARPRRRDNGDVVWDGIVIDISERKQAEAEARLARTRLQEALDSLSEGFIYFDADERLIACNSTYREYFREAEARLRPGTRFGDWTRAVAASGMMAEARGREEEWVAERLRDFRNPRGPRDYEFANGRWIRISENRTPSGGTAGIRMDITELKARERALAETEARFRTLFESAPISIWDEDWSAVRAMMDRLAGEGVAGWRDYFDRNPDQLVEAADLIRVIDINRATLEIYGAPDKDAMIALDKVDRRSPEEMGPFREQLFSFLDGERSWVGNSREKKLDRTEIDVRIRVNIPSQHAGDWARVLTTVEDVTEQTRAEEALRKSESRLQGILDNVADGVITINEAGKIETFNLAAEAMFGYAAVEIAGRAVSSLMPGPDRRKHAGYMRSYQKTGNGKILGVGARELEARRKDGSVFPISLSVGEVRLDGRRVFIGAIRDISARLQAEQALRESEQRLDAFFANAPVGLAMYDEQLRFARVNGPLAEINGVPLEDHIGRTLAEILPESGGRLEASWRSLLKPGRKGPAVQRVMEEVTVNGEVRHHMVARFAIPGPDGRAIGAGSVVADVTDQIRTQEALRDSEARFRDFADSAGDWLWEMDADLRFSYMSANVERLIGLPPEWYYGKTRKDLLGEDYDREAWDEHLATTRVHEPFRDFTYRWGGEGGETRWLRTSGVPVYDAEGRFTGYRGSATDVTLLKQAEEAHGALQAQLFQAQKMEALGTLAGGIAHDFNNVLAIIQGHAEILESGLGESSVGRRSAEKILRAGQRGTDLVKQVLAFTRHREQPFAPVPLDICITQIHELLCITLPANIDFRIDLPGVPAWVLGDATRIDQVIMNLCVNASHAIGEDPGVIEIGLFRCREKGRALARFADARASGTGLPVEVEPGAGGGRHQMRIGVPAPGDCWCLSVRDNGVGMDIATLERAFDPFFTTRDVGKGTGLGLSVVQGIVTAHGGALAVETVPGQGTVFTTYLPVSAAGDGS